MPTLIEKLKGQIADLEAKQKKIYAHKGIKALTAWDKKQIKKTKGISFDDCWNIGELQ